MKRFYYSSSIKNFLKESTNEVVGILSTNSEFAIEQTQRDAWIQQIEILRNVLRKYDGGIFFEFSIPRMGRRIDVVLIIKNVIFVLEFKVGENTFPSYAIDQVWDYSLDLKNFHETSHDPLIAPILIATIAEFTPSLLSLTSHKDKVLVPIKSNSDTLEETIQKVLEFGTGENISTESWVIGKYSPTPTIIEAAMSLYNNHSVIDIARSDASAKNLSLTSNLISEIISNAEKEKFKAIVFVTGVPGAGKTLVGLDLATKHMDKENRTTSVFLSGNGPLVSVLSEALARDKIKKGKEKGVKIKKGEGLREVKLFIQNVHHFRDNCLIEDKNAPFDHVAIFDEAQRAWDKTQTANFMKRKKGRPNFESSEPEFLISCLNRHQDWAVIVCLVGGGQEIHTGEAGISEWIESLNRSFKDWKVFISSKLTDSEYTASDSLSLIEKNINVIKKDELHLSVSMRSFLAENVSLLVKNILDMNLHEAVKNLELLSEKYPIILTRDLNKAKQWLKEKSRGSERYGTVVSSQAIRLKPLAIDVKSPTDPIHWFLGSKEDIRSSYYLEDVATEFQVQGLELDWSCVTWDGDFRYSKSEWETYSFVGEKWNKIKKAERKQYLKNAYRVLLTRARQGMVIVVPFGDTNDHTRKPEYYDTTFNYLNGIGFEVI